MAALTKDDILHIAKLAKLDLSDAEIKKYSSELTKVIDYFSEISEVDTKNTEPTSQTTGLTDVFRTDDIGGYVSLTQEEAISGSDKIHNGLFKVGAVLENRTDK